MALFDPPLLAALNHLLAAAPWASERLRPFAGQTLRIDGLPLGVHWAVTTAGLFASAPEEASPAVTITLPPDVLALAAVDRERIFSSARLAGSADFAEAIGFVFRHLDWDVEADLADVVGDIVAHRLVRGGRHLLAWQQQAGRNLAANVVEYLVEEKKLLAEADEISDFSRAVAALRDDLARLEKRVARLEKA